MKIGYQRAKLKGGDELKETEEEDVEEKHAERNLVERNLVERNLVEEKHVERKDKLIWRDICNKIIITNATII